MLMWQIWKLWALYKLTRSIKNILKSEKNLLVIRIGHPFVPRRANLVLHFQPESNSNLVWRANPAWKKIRCFLNAEQENTIRYDFIDVIKLNI